MAFKGDCDSVDNVAIINKMAMGSGDSAIIQIDLGGVELARKRVCLRI